MHFYLILLKHLQVNKNCETFTGKQKLNEKNCRNLLDRITMLFWEENKENLIFHTKDMNTFNMMLGTNKICN